MLVAVYRRCSEAARCSVSQVLVAGPRCVRHYLCEALVDRMSEAFVVIECLSLSSYGVATVSRINNITGLFFRI